MLVHAFGLNPRIMRKKLKLETGATAAACEIGGRLIKK